ncbi:MAG: PhoPQ-activated pathogenicity, partial [Bryobacterales bacterium]|nr:PhoPQ-activated pathogenicity [Bryobacterales bacterium]
MRLSALALVSVALFAASKETALDRYVKTPDSNYKYKLEKTLAGGGASGYVLNMTSQQYLTAAEVDRPLWQHWVTITKPDTVSSSIALLIISGGSNPSRPPERLDPGLTEIARNAQAVVVELRQIPNEPLTFAGETKKRTEDAIIAYTWDKYLRTGDEKWPLRL